MVLGADVGSIMLKFSQCALKEQGLGKIVFHLRGMIKISDNLSMRKPSTYSCF